MTEFLRELTERPDDGTPRAWHDAFDDLLAPVRFVLRTPPGTDATPADPTQMVAHLGYLGLLSLSAGPLRVTRTPRLIARSPGTQVAVVVQQSGMAALTQDGRSTALPPGHAAFIDVRRPFSLEQRQPFRLLLVSLPEQVLGQPADRMHRISGRAIPPGEGVAGLLIPFLERLPRIAAQLPSGAGDLLAGSTVGFVTLLIDELLGEEHRPRGSARTHLVSLIRQFIDRNLGDLELTPERVAEAHHISVRYLHRLFEGEGVTVGRLIQQRRVEECGRELGRRGRATPTISAVARRWGFHTPAHFSRTFKGVYGLSPRQWRLAGTPQLSPTASGADASRPPHPRAEELVTLMSSGQTTGG
ncbi:helix-turn-helix domain-containing protein [Streptomyces sp. NPDC091271]|uniref:helix-turn-helix domain-containing protein n=1 Tax=Streptomyces sp. NPDC091271 TaxID=3365980 RepID=UPI003808F313